jgi:hypothetical protein
MKGFLGALVAVAMLASAPAASGAQDTFNFTGTGQIWTAPEGVTEATFDVFGGQGGNSIYWTSAGGLGGRATATMPVTPGRNYLVIVGSRAHMGEQAVDFTVYGGHGSEVRSGFDLEDRMIAAGGGGGSVDGDGAPGGFPGSKLDGIDGGTAHPFASPPNGPAGASWGPFGTEYEQGARAGDGLVTITYTVDKTAPVVTITKAPRSVIKTTKEKARAEVSFGSETGASFVCRFDDAEFEPCDSPYRVKARSGSGKGKKHSIAVRATDAAGNGGKRVVTEFRVIRK